MPNLSTSQREAVCHKDGPMLVLAGPGSGKTRVITYRIQHLIQEYQIPPGEILVVTFTRAAAREMKERFLKLMHQEYTQVSFGTFHAVFFGILKHAYGFRAEQIVSSEQQYEFLRDLARKMRLEIEDEGEFLSDVLGEIGRVKNQGLALETYHASCCEAKDFQSIYKGYDQRLRRARLLDFDDMMVYCQELFSQRPDILEAWQRKYHYILVDEFQDINRLQYNIVRMLAAPDHNLFVVGDDDQAIYGFRGACPELMLRFPEDYPCAKRVLLDQNYRSTPQIVEKSLCLIRQNENRFKKELRAQKPEGPPVTARIFADQEEQLNDLVSRIRLYGEKGGKYSDVAVLFRINTQASGLVEKLMERNIPFQMKDRLPNLYDHWIAKHIFAYIRMALGSRKRQDFLLIMNRPKRYLSREALEGEEVCLEELYKLYEEKPWICERLEKLEYDWKMIARMKPFGAIHYIRHIVGYEEYLREYAQYRGIKPEEFLEIYEEIQEQSRRFESFGEWLDYVEEYKKELLRQTKEQEQRRDGVVLSTMHSSKGLEYRMVFIIDANEGIIPYKKAALPQEIEEERRLFYVAMTRAREALYIYAVRERYGKRQSVSRFFLETGAEQRERIPGKIPGDLSKNADRKYM
ncbi:MAG: ATP-dependent helicase [Lachnospiraceae bacterium]|nr:ATP-dependent helicase [Lachnospiraceae bacterium]